MPDAIPRITDRSDAITHIDHAYRTATRPAPRSVKIEFTGLGDRGCTFSARSFRLRERQDIERALFDRLLPEMRAACVEEPGLFYLGRSFRRDWFENAVAYAKRDCGFPYVFLTTNGSVAAPERMYGCFGAGLDLLKFSYFDADGTQFETNARVKPRMYR